MTQMEKREYWSMLAERSAIAAEERELLAQAMACLPPKERVAVFACVVLGVTLRRVAIAVNRSPEVIRNRRDRGLRRMKKMIVDRKMAEISRFIRRGRYAAERLASCEGTGS